MYLTEQAQQAVKEELEDLKKTIRDNIISTGRNASGKTIQSLRIEMQKDGGILWGSNYFGVLETGRQRGKGPYRFQDVILQWMEDKGIQVEKPKSFAFLVARKIVNEGTTLYRNGGDDEVYSKEIERTMESTLKRIGVLFETEVEHINLNTNENKNN